MAEPERIFYKTVLMPVSVSYGDFCFGDGRVCGYFDNTGGHRTCDLFFYPLKRDKEGRVMKPEECRNLKEVK